MRYTPQMADGSMFSCCSTCDRSGKRSYHSESAGTQLDVFDTFGALEIKTVQTQNALFGAWSTKRNAVEHTNRLVFFDCNECLSGPGGPGSRMRHGLREYGDAMGKWTWTSEPLSGRVIE